MKICLSEFTPGETGRVVTVKGEGLARRRLFDMGITPGAEITMRKTAPLGDPIEVTIRGYELSIRRAEAESVVMDKEEESQK
jgi:Fe2+ transport system protein FeoA